MSNRIPTPTMGEILTEEFMIPMNLTAYKLAHSIHVPTSRIQDIVERDNVQGSCQLFSVGRPDPYVHFLGTSCLFCPYLGSVPFSCVHFTGTILGCNTLFF